MNTTAKDYTEIMEALAPAKYDLDQTIEMRIALIEHQFDSIKALHWCRCKVREIPDVLNTWNTGVPANHSWQFFTSRA